MADFNSLTIAIPENNPFKNDKLNREPVARMLKNILTKYYKGAVVSLDSPWGTGKTTFIRMFSCLLRQEHFVTLHFNAWESDYADDPLCALLSELGKRKQLPETIKSNLGRILIAGTSEIAKGFVKKLSGVECDSVQDAIKASIDECATIGGETLQAYNEKKKGLNDFKDSLSEFIANSFSKDEKCQLPIIFFIDELDRCNPHYAIKVLERLKHCFSIPDIVFILSIDKTHLLNSIKGYFHSPDMNAEEYLRRFIDVEFHLPIPDNKVYCEYLAEKFDVKHFLKFDGINDDEINEIIVNVANQNELSLRQLEKFYGHLYIICSSFSIKYHAQYVAFFLLLLKFKPLILDGIKHKKYNIADLYRNLINIFPNSMDDYNYFIGQIIGLYGRYAHLINTRKAPEEWISQDETMTDDSYQMLYSGMKLTAIDSIGFHPRLESVLSHIYPYSMITKN